MATHPCDVVETLDALLAEAGYVVHNGDADTGVTVPDGSGADWWFTWAAPGMAGYECGDTCGSALEALAGAARHWFANAEVPVVRF